MLCRCKLFTFYTEFALIACDSQFVSQLTKATILRPSKIGSGKILFRQALNYILCIASFHMINLNKLKCLFKYFIKMNMYIKLLYKHHTNEF